MESQFIIIAITPEYFFEGEPERISQILRNREADFVHIRKPASTKQQVLELIKTIPLELHGRLKLHDHFDVLDELELGGVHLNSRNPMPHPGAKSVSKSIHSFEEIHGAKDTDYYFISPVFDSISKPGYKSKFDMQELSDKVKGTKGIALGGVTPDKIPQLKEAGFSGAAMSGYFFKSSQLENQCAHSAQTR